MSCFFLEVVPNRNSNLAPGPGWARARWISSSGGRWKLVYLEIGHVSVDVSSVRPPIRVPCLDCVVGSQCT